MTKTRKAFKTAAVLALVALSAFILAIAPACSCQSYQHDVFDYGAIVFEDVTRKELDDAVDNARAKISKGSLALSGAIDKVSELLNHIAFNYQYSYLEYLKDTQGDYKETYTNYDTLYTYGYKQYMDLLYDVMKAGALNFSAEDKAIIEQNHATVTDDYVQIQGEITALETAYNDLSTEDGYEVYADGAAEILIKLVGKYNTLAANNGEDNYIATAYAGYGRTYDATQAQEVCDYVKQYIGPLLDNAAAGVDAAADKLSGASDALGLQQAARGEDETKRNYKQIEQHAAEIGGYMSEPLAYLGECNLHYKATATKDPNAMQGALTTLLPGYNVPYIYQYCSGGYNDMMTFVHEFGHFTAFYNLGNGASADLDVAEIQSQGNEMLFMPRLYEIYGNNVGDYLVKSQLFDSLYWSVTMGCLLDEFQRTIYAAPDAYATADAINDLFETLMTEYNADAYGDVLSEQTGYDFNRYWWAGVSHTFSSPFYYISYAMSALPALTIYQDSQKATRTEAILEYNAIQQYGNGSGTFEQVLDRAGVASPFNKTTIRDLASFLKGEFAA